MENKKTNQVATKAGKPCSHTFKCMNCKGDHQVDSVSGVTVPTEIGMVGNNRNSGESRVQ